MSMGVLCEATSHSRTKIVPVYPANKALGRARELVRQIVASLRRRTAADIDTTSLLIEAQKH